MLVPKSITKRGRINMEQNFTRRCADAGVTIVIPCLNEASTLPELLKRIQGLIKSKSFGERKVDILVSDNGSTDGSKPLARALGVTVTDCPVRGYGSALRHGIEQAKTPVVMFLDADLTYAPEDAPKLLAALDVETDMVLGDRLSGEKINGAMPPMHRYLGTPVLTFMINSLFSKGTRIRDCNSGYRCFWKDPFLKWGITGTGMEFASEMLVRSLQTGAIIKSIPITLYPNPHGRVPHLRPWRDGMRHILQILLEAPFIFNNVGIGMMLFGWTGLLVSLSGPYPVLGASVFGAHSAVICMLLVLIGQDIWTIGLFVSLKSGTAIAPQYRWAVRLNESILFWLAVFVFLVIMAGSILTVVQWSQNHFASLAFEPEFIMAATLIMQVVEIEMGLLTASMVNKIIAHTR